MTKYCVLIWVLMISCFGSKKRTCIYDNKHQFDSSCLGVLTLVEVDKTRLSISAAGSKLWHPKYIDRLKYYFDSSSDSHTINFTERGINIDSNCKNIILSYNPPICLGCNYEEFITNFICGKSFPFYQIVTISDPTGIEVEQIYYFNRESKTLDSFSYYIMKPEL